jgi:hypothetical protein
MSEIRIASWEEIISEEWFKHVEYKIVLGFIFT